MYICLPEAIHRLMKFNMHKISHAVYRQAVHNENEQHVYFKECKEEAFINNDLDTTLTAWFKLN